MKDVFQSVLATLDLGSIEVVRDPNGPGSNIYDVYFPSLYLSAEGWRAPDRGYRVELPFLSEKEIEGALAGGLLLYRERFKMDPVLLMLMCGAEQRDRRGRVVRPHPGYGVLLQGHTDPRKMVWPACTSCGSTRPVHERDCPVNRAPLVGR